MASSLAWGTATVTTMGTTPTQAVLSYTLSAPTGAACLVEISASPTFTPLVHDVDPLLFADSNKDNRSGAIMNGTNHVMVVGTRGAAQMGLDGRWYSRALAAFTTYYGRINNDSACDSDGPATVTFTTVTIPMGRLYNETIPTSPQSPGITAWPQVTGTSRVPVVDPQTGAVIVPVQAPGDQPSSSNTGTAFQAPFDATGTWACTSGALPCTYGGSNQAKLFLPVYINNQLQPSYEYLTYGFLTYLYAHVAGSVGSGPQTVDFCLTRDGVTCATNVLQKMFTSTISTYNVGGTNFGFTDWSAAPLPFDHVKIARKTGSVSVSGGVITTSDGSHFVPPYANGTPIALSGTGCSGTFTAAGAASDTDSQMTLTMAPLCTNASYTLTPFGLLLWADSSATLSLSIASAGTSFDWEIDYDAQEDSSPMQLFGNQAGGPVIDLAGCPGYLAYHTAAWYWESAQCQTSNYLGQWSVPYQQGLNPTELLPAGACAFDPVNAGVAVCPAQAYSNDTILIKVAYSGNFAPVAPGTTLPACSGSNQPCLTITTIETSLVGKLRAYSPEFAADCCGQNPVGTGGCPDGTIMIQVLLAGQQGVAGWLAIYDPAQTGFVAARKSTDSYNVTGNGFHSVMPRCAITSSGARLVGYGAQLGPIGDLGSPLSGVDPNAGGGPYRLRVPAGLGSVTQTCPRWPGSRHTPIAEQDWPGGTNNPGTQCTTDPVASNILEDPSPNAVNLTVNATNGSTAVAATSGAFLRAYIGKPILIGGSLYTIATFVDSTDITINGAFAGATGIYPSTTVQTEPPCSFTGLSCDNPADFGLRQARSGDKLFVGAPTSGVTLYQDFYHTCYNSTSEALMVLSVKGTSITWQRGYGNAACGVTAWSGPVYLYADSGNYAYFNNQGGASNWDDVWDTTDDPTGALQLDLIDYGDQSGHGGRFQGFWSIFDATSLSPLQTLWDGMTTLRATYRSRVGYNFSYITAPSTFSAMTAPFSCVLGAVTANVCTPVVGLGNPNAVDTHLSWPYIAQPAWFLDGRPLDYGLTNNSNLGTQVSGTLYRFTYAQRGFSSAQAAVSADKVLPPVATCGQHPLLNIGGPGAVIDGTGANGYKYLTVVNAGEGVSGSNPGDLYVNCPGASVIGSNDGGLGNNGGNVIDITLAPNGAWAHGNVQVDVSKPSAADGSRTRWLGHTLARYRFYNGFWNVRATPDGLGMLSQVIGLNGNASATVMTVLPPIVYDSINGADFVPVTFQLNPPAGYSIDNAIVEFGYAENGDPAIGPFCTSRQETCAKGSQSGNIFHYETSESGSYSGQPCSSGCTVTVPAISGRSLYYRVKFRNGSTAAFIAAEEVLSVP
jgi:hypothetical protein